jgi:hypothetical protein
VFAVLRRNRIISVAVFIANSSITPMYYHLGALIDCNLPSRVDCLTLRSVNACKSVVALTSNAPFAVNGNNVLIFPHLDSPFLEF